MIKPVAVAVFSLLAFPVQAQTTGDLVAAQYVDFMKAKVAVKACATEVGTMQIARNEHYDALIKSNATDPGAPTLDEISNVLAQLRDEDEALSEKRDECQPLFDQLTAATIALRRDCAAYVPPTASDEPPETADTLAADICHARAKSGEGEKASTQ
jgi:hypothetical protein